MMLEFGLNRYTAKCYSYPVTRKKPRNAKNIKKGHLFWNLISEKVKYLTPLFWGVFLLPKSYMGYVYRLFCKIFMVLTYVGLVAFNALKPVYARQYIRGSGLG
jgi:hypothetical protein